MKLEKEKVEKIIEMLEEANRFYESEYNSIDDDVYDMIEYLKKRLAKF